MAIKVAPGVLCLRAGNPSPMTHTGTNSYILQGRGAAVVIDPGPALPAHLAALLAGLGDQPLAAILVTHAHLDHSELAPALAAATGAPVMAFGRADAGRSPLMQRLAAAGLSGGGEGADAGFAPDRLLHDGERLDLAGLQIEAIHTPGHMGCHLSFGFGDIAFTGDHVMGWASSLVSPPDGDMAAYRAALARLAARRWTQLLPGHGDPIADPAARIAFLARHRADREAQIRAALASATQTGGALTPAEIAARLYTDTPPALLGAAARNVLAHLIDLHERNLAACDTTPGPAARFHAI